MNVNALLTARQVADLLGCHVNTVKRIHPADLPFWRLSSRGDRRYSPADVDRYIDERKVGDPTPPEPLR